jgi:hypothetical protein
MTHEYLVIFEQGKNGGWELMPLTFLASALSETPAKKPIG